MSIEFKRDVEPGIIKIFDMSIIYKDGKDNVLNNDKNEIRMMSLRDDEFMFDKVTYNEELFNNRVS